MRHSAAPPRVILAPADVDRCGRGLFAFLCDCVALGGTVNLNCRGRSVCSSERSNAVLRCRPGGASCAASARIGDAQLLGDLLEWRDGSDQLNRLAVELRRVRRSGSRHVDILPARAWRPQRSRVRGIGSTPRSSPPRAGCRGAPGPGMSGSARRTSAGPRASSGASCARSPARPTRSARRAGEMGRISRGSAARGAGARGGPAGR